MKITIPYACIHQRNDGNYDAALRERFEDSLLLGIVDRPTLRADDTLEIDVLIDERVKLDDIWDIVTAGGEVEFTSNWHLYASVLATDTVPDDLSVNLETFGEWFPSQAPYINPREKDGRHYFGLNPNGVNLNASTCLRLAAGGLQILTPSQYRAATKKEEPVT